MKDYIVGHIPIFWKILVFICAIISISVIIWDCRESRQPCKYSNEQSGIFSKSLGIVQLDNEACQIFETYEVNCKVYNGTDYYCSGEGRYCETKTLTRITKCPSGMATNHIIPPSADKNSREELQ